MLTSHTLQSIGFVVSSIFYTKNLKIIDFEMNFMVNFLHAQMFKAQCVHRYEDFDIKT